MLLLNDYDYTSTGDTNDYPLDNWTYYPNLVVNGTPDDCAVTLYRWYTALMHDLDTYQPPRIIGRWSLDVLDKAHYPYAFATPIQPISDDPFSTDELEVIATFDARFTGIHIAINRTLDKHAQNAIFTLIGTHGSHCARCTVQWASRAIGGTTLLVIPNKTIHAYDLDKLKTITVQTVRDYLNGVQNTVTPIQQSLF